MNEHVIRSDRGRYRHGEIVGVFEDKFGEEKTVHRPKGRRLRVLKNLDTPVLRMNRVAAELIGQLIRERRISAGLTLEELGERAGLSSLTKKQYVWGIEHATRGQGVRIGTLYAIARILKCEVGDLLPSVDTVARQSDVTDIQIVRAI